MTDADPPASSTVLAVCWHDKTLGYALLHDWEPHHILVGALTETSDHEGLRMLKASCKPTMLLVPQKGKVAPSHALSALDGAARPPGVKLVSPAEFSVDFAKEKLTAGTRTLQQWSLHIDISAVPMMRALGALLAYAQRSRYVIEVDELVLTRHTVAQTVIVEDDVFKELQIFKLEAHPAGHQGIGKAKEGLSLYGVVASRAKTPLGRALLREWFLRPTNDVVVLSERLECVEFFCRESLGEAVRGALRHIHPTTATLAKLTSGNHVPSDWDRLYRTSYHFASLVKMMAEAPCALPALLRVDRMVGGITCLLGVCESIGRVIDMERSLAANRIHVREGCDPELDKCNAILATIPSFLTGVAQRELERLPSDISHALVLHVVYFPQFGYHIAVPATTPGPTCAALEALDWQRVFTTDEHVFFKNAAVSELDGSLGDVHTTIGDIEARLVRDLEGVVADPAVAATLSHISYVWRMDCLLGLAEAAVEHHWVRPTLSSCVEFDISCGRHPLLSCRAPVANDITLRPQGPRVCILTGANNSGKSMFLKQCALIVFMAHVGSFVPAEAATVGPFAAIMTCTVSSMHGSFSSDVMRVGRILRFPSPNVFVVVDEFGKGTLAEDGIALLAAIVNEFLGRGNACPLVLLTTHYTEVLERGLVPPAHPLLDVCSMVVGIVADGGVSYSYRKTMGIAASSHALPLAIRCGVPQAIVDRATVVGQHVQCGLRVPPRAMDTPAVQERRHHALRVLRAFAAFDFVTGDVNAFHGMLQRSLDKQQQ